MNFKQLRLAFLLGIWDIEPLILFVIVVSPVFFPLTPFRKHVEPIGKQNIVDPEVYKHLDEYSNSICGIPVVIKCTFIIGNQIRTN